MGIGDFFNSVNTTMTNWGGTFYMGMFVLTILMMVLVFSWLNSKDADNSLIIGTAVLLFIPAFVFLTLWMSSVWTFSPLEKMKKALEDAILKGKTELATAFAKALGPDVARAVLEGMIENNKATRDQAEPLLQELNRSEEAAADEYY